MTTRWRYFSFFWRGIVIHEHTDLFAIKIIMKKWEILKNRTTIPRNKFFMILQFYLSDNNYFAYAHKFYQRTFDMLMGNLLWPTLADIALDNLLDDIMTKFQNLDTVWWYSFASIIMLSKLRLFSNNRRRKVWVQQKNLHLCHYLLQM